MDTKYSQQSVKSLYKKRDRIDLEPYFQREKVWKKSRKQYFIDTLLKGWGIPKIYLLNEEPGSTISTYSCIDGKQRLTAIFEFISGDYKTSSDYDNLLGEKSYTELPDDISDKFDDYQIPIEEVSNATPKEITELFKRLQLGIPLNSGENLMAIDGYLKNNLKSLYNHDFFKEKISIRDTRYSHFVVCTQIAFLEINGIANMSLRALENFLKNNDDESKIGLNIGMKLKKINITLDYLNRVFPQRHPILKNRATIVSFYLLISKLLDQRNLEGKEARVRNFFEKFSRELDKQVNLGTKSTDTVLIHYQNSIIQGADKQKAIKTRQDILLQKLSEYSKDLYKLFYQEISLREQHEKLFAILEKKHKSQENINNFIIEKYPKVKIPKCNTARNLTKKETLPLHVRNCLIHKDHGSVKNSQITESIKILEIIIKSIK